MYHSILGNISLPVFCLTSYTYCHGPLEKHDRFACLLWLVRQGLLECSVHAVWFQRLEVYD